MSRSPEQKRARSVHAAPALRSLRLFIVIFTFLAEIVIIAYGEIVRQRLYCMLPMALGYMIAVAIARRFDNKFIITLSGVILAAAAAASGFDTLSWIFNGVLAVIGFANALRERLILKRTGDKPDNIFFAFAGLGALIVMLMVSWLSEKELAGQFVFTMIMVYFPLAFCTWLYEGIDYYVGQFADRRSQPVSAVRRNVSEWVVPLILLIALAAAFMPYKDGKTLAFYAYKGLILFFYGIITALGKLMELLTIDNAEDSIVSATQLEPNVPAHHNESMFSDTIAKVFAFAVLAVFAVSVIYSLVRRLIQAIIAGYSLRPASKDDGNGNDVIERIEPSPDAKRRRLFSRQTTAEKVRGIYRNTVAGLVKHGVKPSVSDSPDEICAAAGEKGFDLSELTEIYKQARYTESCPDELLSRARYLSRHLSDTEAH